MVSKTSRALTHYGLKYEITDKNRRVLPVSFVYQGSVIKDLQLLRIISDNDYEFLYT